jgi:hypothetical protein
MLVQRPAEEINRRAAELFGDAATS